MLFGERIWGTILGQEREDGVINDEPVERVNLVEGFQLFEVIHGLSKDVVPYVNSLQTVWHVRDGQRAQEQQS